MIFTEKDELDRDMEFLYNDTMNLNDENYPPKALTIYGNYTRLYLAMTDKNRPGSYNFTVGDYIDRVELYYPKGYVKPLKTIIVILFQFLQRYAEFDKLPEGWNPFLKQNDQEPTAWLMSLAGIIVSFGIFHHIS